MNSITIAGTLGRDAELKYLSNGDALCSFSVADGQGRDKPTIWWNCALYGKRAEALSKYLNKGQAVTVSGQITEREFTDKNGNQRKSMDVRVNELALQGGRKEQDAKPAQQAPAETEQQDDIPF